ncbi:HemK family protein methyltransferase [Candidatus Saccharibacteria bacterium]|nr:HemK family protein methyltransferase [Candidatus Saccharibacteria bacterium]
MKPIAYQLGFIDFYGRNFKVTPDVLIPRPETEQLIDEALNLAGQAYLPGVKPEERKLKENPLILDVGTGSGVIAIALKLEIPDSTVIGLDISEAALKVARENAKNLKADIILKTSDLLKNYDGKEPDLITANLPYVDKNWDWLDMESLKEEPEIALFAEDGGLKLIKQLLTQIRDRDWHPKILLEMDPSQQDTLINFAKTIDFKHQKTTGFIISLY